MLGGEWQGAGQKEVYEEMSHSESAAGGSGELYEVLVLFAILDHEESSVQQV